MKTSLVTIPLVCALLTSGCATDDVLTKTKAHYEPSKNRNESDVEVPGNPAYKALLPFAVLFDVATSPLQAVAILVIGLPTAPKPTKKNP